MKHILFLAWCCPVLLAAQPSFNMSLLSNWDLPNLPSRFGAEYSDCWGYKHVNGTEVAIIGGIEEIFFVDVTIPGAPELIYAHPVDNAGGTTNQSLWRDFQTYEHYAYACSDEGTAGLLIFDLSNVPNSVTLVDQTSAFFTRTHTIFIDEENARLYAGGSNTVANGLVVLDLQDPINPTLLGNVPLNTFGGGYVHDMYARDNIVYCSHGNLSKLTMYNMANLSNITVTGVIENYPEDGYNHSSWVNEDETMLVMCDETHGSDVKLVDITNPADISNDDIHTFYSELEGAAAPGSSVAHNPFILGDFAYIAYYQDGVQVFDISDPENIALLAYYDTYPDNDGYSGYDGCWGVYPYFPSGIVIGSDQNYGLYVLQVASFPLDIEYVDFDAVRQQRGVKLNWSVIDATAGDHFEIKRSQDGGLTFITIAETALIDGQTNYAYHDYTAFDNTSYAYRIDFEQYSGAPITSPMRHVKALQQPNVVRAMNPITSDLVIHTREPITDVKVQLHDGTGKLVWTREIETSSPHMEFSLAGMPAAYYMLRVAWNGGSLETLVNKIE